jgi:hypothetical protein
MQLTANLFLFRDLTMTDCTLSDNTARGGAGGSVTDGQGGNGGDGFGGAIFNLNGGAFLADDTIDGNTVSAGRGGPSFGSGTAGTDGLFDGGAVFSLAFGSYVSGFPAGAYVHLDNCIFADSPGIDNLSAPPANGAGDLAWEAARTDAPGSSKATTSSNRSAALMPHRHRTP